MTQSQKSAHFIIAIKYNIIHSQSDSRGSLGKKQTPPKIFLNLGISTAIVPPESAEALAVAHTTVSVPLVPQNGEEPEALGAKITKWQKCNEIQDP